MIPYDELCEALARYRTRHGMANGASASPQRAQAPVAAAPAYTPPAYSPPAGYAQQGFVPAATAEDYVGGPSADDRTDIHERVAPREDTTGEIDIDSVDVVEEDDA